DILELRPAQRRLVADAARFRLELERNPRRLGERAQRFRHEQVIAPAAADAGGTHNAALADESTLAVKREPGGVRLVDAQVEAPRSVCARPLLDRNEELRADAAPAPGAAQANVRDIDHAARALEETAERAEEADDLRVPQRHHIGAAALLRADAQALREPVGPAVAIFAGLAEEIGLLVDGRDRRAEQRRIGGRGLPDDDRLA